MEPVAKKIKMEFNNFGNSRSDYYHWMRERDSKDVLDYINQENEYTSKKMMSTEILREVLVEEFKSLELETEESFPSYSYYSKYWSYKVYKKELEYPMLYRKYETLDAEPELIADINKLSEGHDYFDIGSIGVTKDNKYLVYSYDSVSRRKYKIVFQDRETGEYLSDVIENTTGSIVLLLDSKTVFYVLEDETTLRPFKVMRHTIGTSVEDDVLVYQENDEEYNVGVGKSLEYEMVYIMSSCKVNNEIKVIPFSNLDAEPEVLLEREDEHFYSLAKRGDEYFIYTNYEAKNFRLVKCNVKDLKDKSKWVDVIPHDEDVYLENFCVYHDYITVSKIKDYKKEINVIHDNGNIDVIDFKEDVYDLMLGSESYQNTDLIYYYYDSMTTPNTMFEYNVKTKETKLIKQVEIPGDFDSNNYTSKRDYVTARDGEKIPVSYVYKNTTELKDAPMLLYAYGSYGHSIDPSFSGTRLSLLDRGVVYVIAHIRGGDELGVKWHDDGKMLNKKNTFNDFIDCAKYFIDSGITSPEKLVANGGSAGGLLMGVVANEAPELFKAIVADVPFVDVINTMLDETLPLTVGEYKEWGNPNEKEYYDYMLSYSPYDNVKAQDYPNMLVYSGYYDSQVQYWEPLKWVAKLREMRTNKDKELILKMDMNTGHGYGSTKTGYYTELAFKFAFILKMLNI